MRHLAPRPFLNQLRVLCGGILLFLLLFFNQTSVTGRDKSPDNTSPTLPNRSELISFTNLANVLIRSQFNFGITNIPIAPTNEYSTAVHRLLQVAANIQDSTTNSSFPSVFRPRFTVDGTNVFISGYYEDNDANNVSAWLNDNPYGIPFVVGAKKGIPNFNKYVMQTAVQVARKLELRRDSTNSPPNQTNQLFIIGISNLFGLESWNSYTQAFAGDLKMEAGIVASMTLTNHDGLFYRSSGVFGVVSNIPPGQWSGAGFTRTRRIPIPFSFKVPLQTNVITLPNSVYRSQPPLLEPVGPLNRFESGFPIPELIVTISNRFTYILSSGGQILDFVHLPHLDTYINVTEQFTSQGHFSEPSAVASTWLTNRINNSTSLASPTEGIVHQIDISLGNGAVSLNEWIDYNQDRNTTSGSARNKAIDDFRAFFGLPLLNPNNPINNRNLIVQAPFSPTRKFYQTIIWEANDPLVHYMAEDLRDFADNPTPTLFKPFGPPPPNSLGRLSTRYKPWGGNPLTDPSSDLNASYVGVKDAGVFKSDDWNFPTNAISASGWLGRIHRGTPWQTIYLKSEVAEPARWLGQSPDLHTHPTNDWRLAAQLVSLLNTNDPTTLFSINQTNPIAWGDVFDGMMVLSNTVVVLPSLMPQFESLVMRSNSPQVALIVDGINRTRSERVPPYFRQVGDILSVPELSVASPWLNLSSELELFYGINDEAYEMIPDQLLPLLRADLIGFIRWVGGELVIEFTVFPGHEYAVETSTDLQHWKRISRHFASEGTFQFLDPAGTTHGCRFYRAALLSGKSKPFHDPKAVRLAKPKRSFAQGQLPHLNKRGKKVVSGGK